MKNFSVQNFKKWEYEYARLNRRLSIHLGRGKIRREILKDYGNLFIKKKGDNKKSAVTEQLILSQIQSLKEKRDYAIINCIFLGRQKAMSRYKIKAPRVDGADELVTNSAPEESKEMPS